MEIKLNQNDKKLFKMIGLIIFLGFWVWVLFFYGRPKEIKLGLYEITLKEVIIDGSDFNRDFWGAPLPIYLNIYKDNERVFNKPIGRLRGKRIFEHVYFKVYRSNKSIYRVVLTEDSIISNAVSWSYPANPKHGEWYFDKEISFGHNKKVKFPDDKKNRNYIKFESKYLE
jgi:hypothetical protein